MSDTSQLRKHLRFSWLNRLRSFYWQFRLGEMGSGIFIDANVRLERFPANIRILDNVVLKEGARLCACNENAFIDIGRNTTIGFYTFIYASERISVGDDCLIAPFVYIVDSDHGISRQTRINRQPNTTAPISVGNDVWVGTGAKLLKGVKIGDGAIIAAGALVREDVQPYDIVGGMPARIIGVRS